MFWHRLFYSPTPWSIIIRTKTLFFSQAKRLRRKSSFTVASHSLYYFCIISFVLFIFSVAFIFYTLTADHIKDQIHFHHYVVRQIIVFPATSIYDMEITNFIETNAFVMISSKALFSAAVSIDSFPQTVYNFF